MTDILITAVLWGVALGISSRGRLPEPLRNLSRGLGREHTAMVLLLLAIHARVQREGAADALNNPLVFETALRGLLLIGAMAIILPVARQTIRLSDTVRRRRYAIAAFGAYVAVAALTVFFAAAPTQTLGKAAEVGALFVLVWHLVSRPDASEAIKKTIALVVYLEFTLVATAAIGFFVLPDLFAEQMSRRGFFFEATMISPYGSSNSLSARGAMIAAAAAILFFKSSGRTRWFWAVAGGLSTLAIVLASGRQGIAILVIGLGIVLFLVNRQAFFLLGLPAAALVMTLGFQQIIDVLSRDQVEGSLATLTGRTTFWAAGLDSFIERPWTGWGFGGSRYSALASIGASEFTHLHNGYLEALVGVGLLGFIPLMITLGLVIQWAWGKFRTLRDPEFAILLVGLVLQNAIGSGFGSWLNFNLVIFALLVGLADADRPLSRRVPTDRRAQRLAITSR